MSNILLFLRSLLFALIMLIVTPIWALVCFVFEIGRAHV